MIAKIQKWGNSLGGRIPKSVAQDVRDWGRNSVELSVEEGRVVVAPLKSRKYTLKELADKITPQNMQGESDWGPAVGKEARSETAIRPPAGDLVWLDFEPHAGHEQAGRRPALGSRPSMTTKRPAWGFSARSPVKSKDFRLKSHCRPD